MTVVKNNALVENPFVFVADASEIPADGAILVPLALWRSHRETLLERRAPLGIQLRSDEPPDAISEDLHCFEVVALEFPAFRDGRAYSYARILRERYGYEGEIRAVGDVLMEQLHFMLRTGFNAFDIEGDDPLGTFRAALEDFSVWYQPTGDGRSTAMQLRQGFGGRAKPSARALTRGFMK